MIFDKFENLDLYFDKNDKLYKAICFARDFNTAQGNTKFEISGKDIYATSASYTTKSVDESCFENHRKYIDVHVILEGEELHGHTVDDSIDVLSEYDEETDLKTYKRPTTYNSVVLKPGKFVVFYPQDLHMPNCCVNEQTPVKKLVVKISV